MGQVSFETGVTLANRNLAWAICLIRAKAQLLGRLRARCAVADLTRRLSNDFAFCLPSANPTGPGIATALSELWHYQQSLDRENFDSHSTRLDQIRLKPTH